MPTTTKKGKKEGRTVLGEVAHQFVERKKGTLVVYALIMCVATVERIILPHLYGRLLDKLKQRQFDPSLKYLAALILMFLGFKVLDMIMTVLDSRLVPVLEASVRSELVRTIIRRHREHYQELDLGNVTSKMVKLPGNIRTTFYQFKILLFHHVLAVLITAGYLFYCHWSLGAIFVACFAALGLIVWRFQRRCVPFSYAREQSFDQTQEKMQDILLNILSIYNGQTDAHEDENIARANNDTVERTRAHIVCGIPYQVVIVLLFVLTFAGITAQGIALFRRRRIPLATVVSSFIVTFSIVKMGARLFYDCDMFVHLYGSIKVVIDYINRLPSNDDNEASNDGSGGSGSGASISSPLIGDGTAFRPSNPQTGIGLELRDVSLAYPVTVVDDAETRPAHAPAPTLDGVNLSIAPGERVAIVGSIGSGKSSLAQLLLRLQTPQRGHVIWDGVDARRIEVGQLRRRAMFVPQHPRLFNRTLWENLAYGNPRARPDDVYTLLHELGMHDLVRDFRAKMHSSVGKQGHRLSGGQRQMVWLVRALLNEDARLVVLDEPTSSLDRTSCSHVLRAIRRLSRGRTMVIVTHDSRLLPFVDRVVRMEKGRIARSQ